MPKITFFGLKDLNPVQQAFMCAILIGIFSLGCLLFQEHSIMSWNILISPVILFTIMNPLMGIFIDKNRIHYIAISLFCFILLGLIAYLAGCMVSTIKYAESRELILFTFLISLFYCMIYFISFIFKGVVGFLESIDK